MLKWFSKDHPHENGKKYKPQSQLTLELVGGQLTCDAFSHVFVLKDMAVRALLTWHTV